MSDASPFAPPQIGDEGIHWASNLLGLKEDAFYGADGRDPRQDVLKCNETIDVGACPGSGKTTLLVAKLAILAKKWSCRTQGVCVLSHTNAARDEIETKLGNTLAGRRLVSYPHFVGTIHAFVNEFLAIPWLRSKGYSITVIDTEICQRKRWFALSLATRKALETNGHTSSLLSIETTDFSVGDIPWGRKRTPLKPGSPTYNNIREVCRQSATEGYFCYDEMFVWARDLIANVPDVVYVLRDRFPFLFIDEAQDNSESQSRILHHIFMEAVNPVRRQRFGDPNQAIFDFVGLKGATVDLFPDDAIKKELPNSYRFGQKISDLADPLGLTPYGLKGHGPPWPLASGGTEGQSTIFLFEGTVETKVLDAYGELLLETFTDKELASGIFTAVGQIHRPPASTDARKFPHHVGEYWSGYDAELTRQDPKPSTFVGYILAGTEKAKAAGETHLFTEKIADGVLRLARMADGKSRLFHRRHRHRYVMSLLDADTVARARYRLLVSRFGVKQRPLKKREWENCWRAIIHHVGETIAGCPLSGSEVSRFLSWSWHVDSVESTSHEATTGDNVYPYSKDGRHVGIQVGSIHSVKGRTHTATLVLDTFWQRRNLELLIPWLDGSKSGKGSQGSQQVTRLKIHYVAMTRPTHLLCLAMKKSLFTDADGNLDSAKKKWDSRGWRLIPI